MSFLTLGPLCVKTGIVLLVFCRCLIVFQKSFWLALFILLKCAHLAFRNMFTNIFLAELYCCKCLVLPDFLAFLYRRVRLLPTLRISLVNHGRFDFLGIVFWGIHSSIICIYVFSQFARTSFTFPVMTESQLVFSIKLQAFTKSACAYLQIFLLCERVCWPPCFHFSLSKIPLWSEFSSGGITEQSLTWSAEDTKARSMRVSEPFLVLCVEVGIWHVPLLVSCRLWGFPRFSFYQWQAQVLK